MSYVINVATKAKQGQPPRHLFRTAEDSILYQERAIEIARQLRALYPAGTHTIDVSRIEHTGKNIPWEE